MATRDFINDYLSVLGVKHTQSFSTDKFESMSFKSLFGLKCMLKDYGIESYAEKNVQLDQIKTPCIAPLKNGEWVIITSVNDGIVEYRTQGETESVGEPIFQDAWSGVAFVSTVTETSIEPDYCKHRFTDVMKYVRDYGILSLVIILALYGIISRESYHNVGIIVAIVFNLLGLGASIMLEQKSLGIHTKLAAHVCGIIEKEGCDDVLASEGSQFMGIFHWSDVGLGYFGTSLIALIAWPQVLPYVALFNLICLPYSFWSIGYQKFKAHAWCTLCLTVQATLWILAVVYLIGCPHWWSMLSFKNEALYILPTFYILSVLIINKVMSIFNGKRNE